MWRSIACLLLAAPFAVASPPDPVGQPESVHVTPETVVLEGPWATRQLLVIGRYADGSERDLTHHAAFRAGGGNVVDVVADGFLSPRGNGETALEVSVGGRTARVPVIVSGLDKPGAVSFRREVVAVLNVAGCNAGACHGTPSGKNGFKLSLRGFDPAADFAVLTRDQGGRRINLSEPEASLILQKGLGKVAHEGGSRFTADSVPGRLLRAWIAGGAPDDARDLAPLARIEVLPGAKTILAPAAFQQLVVQARFKDGTVKDVTRLTSFSSSDEHVARVSPTGLVEFQGRGEVAILVRYLEELVAVRLTYLQPRPGFTWPATPTNNFVDRHLLDKLKLLQIPPSGLSDDATFIRRAYLDICGILPTPAEVRGFLADRNADKRARLIDTLLERPEFADFWAMKWADVMGNNRRAIQAKGAYAYHQWLRDQVAANTPWDQVARELLTAEGSTFDNPPANYFRSDRKSRDAEGLAQITAQLFMGVRITCAQCHNHPFERWTQDDYHGLAAFFARISSKNDPLNPRVNRFNQGALVIFLNRSGEVVHPRTGKVVPPRFLKADARRIPDGADRRAVLADWLTARDNPYLARALVNRVWFHLLGRGIVDAVDDFRDSNPPASAELLDALATDFVEHRFDVKHVVRTIANSRMYQLASTTTPDNEEDARFFSHAVTRLHPAEVFLDAVSGATGVAEEFIEAKPGTRAVQLPDPDVQHHPFLLAFGQPARETVCECERLGDASLGQALQLINGATVKAKLRAADNRIGQLLAQKKEPAEVLEELYLATLSRLPVEREKRAALEHVGRATDARKAWEDVQWALLNTKEFLFRH